MKISAAAAVKCQVRQGLLTRHEKNFRTFDIFTVCNFAVCTHARGGTNQWRRQEASDMKYELFTQNLKPIKR